MLEKVKGSILGKLRIIEQIKGDIQILNEHNKFQIKKDLRVMKYNYGLRLHYSIEDALLKKRLMYDNSLLNGKETIYNMINLKSCYNQQLAEIGLIVHESIRVERLIIILFSRLLLVREYYN